MIKIQFCIIVRYDKMVSLIPMLLAPFLIMYENFLQQF